jgi:hypothetical protein
MNLDCIKENASFVPLAIFKMKQGSFPGYLILERKG